MTEDFLHYLWQNKLFTRPITTILGESIQVLNTGYHNFNAGPDFSDARLRIGDTLWAGNVEIHVNSSDWFKHGHDHDEAYQNVVLHLVFNHDAKNKFPGMPICELADLIDLNLFEAYKKFIASKHFVPCINLIKEVPESELILWLERMLIEKLEHRADFIQDALSCSTDDWEEALYQIIARSFGFSINALPFEMLARSLPFRILARHADNPMQVEALIFGQAGMLTQDLVDPWGQALFNEYSFLRKKYQLVPIAASLWRFLRLRPVNFPTIRLSQFADFICKNAGLLARVLSMDTIDEMTGLFKIKASAYWDDHYVFDKESAGEEKRPGISAIQLVIMNAILPFMFVYGTSISNDVLCNKTLSLFEKLPGEKNSVIRQWQAAGLNVSSAYYTQALMELKTSYCDKRKCLSCRIGNILFKNPAFSEHQF